MMLRAYAIDHSTPPKRECCPVFPILIAMNELFGITTRVPNSKGVRIAVEYIHL